ncbi:hypothetical protein CPAST_c24880 [Clostridium pasteurianum DSM 525 = ATCC 6013]|uniref:DUF86 domain-containing protein n=1 Tax=Clostridium pasteurianum DSM 525 = ATCC 6013 TaxID=1262449 RepID=A0A0H3J5S8_CLOPA|nr:DUF86 domain-containing protein [Clostridium pasteurianum]AJA48557.1 hypothetical protein CPAST_c24880 [Clostridium pasteurianum DSM 525 = ATCC 6013]AJA52545.1 hypothetical protein CLPA_c24880 [Clostridium pasteurianum DSM 525 = ATCC 6013]AOZ75789.1 hypothetical protein AQ983_12085 [Clostridium pasteurianum DSM 525 = ATCC 6013]AOZ79585.1 hypothetical protein AQ984_12080 [Clostridium pasteurianum]ELP57964.1 hypothetical protein F502_17225 [Clostridium pasteurianum DSM 525 = ATCC 6013]
MVKREIVISRIDKLNEYMRILKSLTKYDRKTYINDPLIYGSAERFLHLSIECILDIANHVIADMRYRRPENNKDIFLVLHENKIIDEKLKNNLCNMAGFRNILVHDYLKLDRALVYDIINNNLNDIEDFIKIVVEYI